MVPVKTQTLPFVGPYNQADEADEDERCSGESTKLRSPPITHTMASPGDLATKLRMDALSARSCSARAAAAQVYVHMKTHRVTDSIPKAVRAPVH